MTQDERVQLAAVAAIIERIDKRAEEDRAEAKIYRKEMADLIRSVEERSSHNTAKLEAVEARLQGVEEVTGMVSRWRYVATGAALAIGAIFTAVGVALDRFAQFLRG